MVMKWYRYACLVFFLSVASGCGSTVSTNPRDYVGEYVFRPSYSDPGQFASFVVLKNDQSAIEVRFSEETGEVQTKQKKWYLDHTTGENVVLGDFSAPIERSGSTIRLVINGDLGQYYEKVR